MTGNCRTKSFHDGYLDVADRRRPLVDDGKPDISDYNKELESLGGPKWFSVPWLFAECYLYRYDE